MEVSKEKELKRPLIEWTPIYSMWLREIIRFFGQRSRVIGAIIQPFLFLGLMAIPMSRLMPPEAEGLMEQMFGGLNFFSYLFLVWWALDFFSAVLWVE